MTCGAHFGCQRKIKWLFKKKRSIIIIIFFSYNGFVKILVKQEHEKGTLSIKVHCKNMPVETFVQNGIMLLLACFATLST